MLATHLHREFDIEVLTVELGGAQKLFPRFIDNTVNGIRNVLKARGLLDGEPETSGQQYFLSERYGVDVREPCEIQFSVQLGDQVHAGDRLGEVYYPLRHCTESLLSPMCGYVFSLWQLNQAPAGQRLFSILEEHQCHVERTTLDKFAAMAPLDIKKIRM